MTITSAISDVLYTVAYAIQACVGFLTSCVVVSVAALEKAQRSQVYPVVLTWFVCVLTVVLFRLLYNGPKTPLTEREVFWTHAGQSCSEACGKQKCAQVLIEQTTINESTFEILYPTLYKACATLEWYDCEKGTEIHGQSCTLCSDGLLNGSCAYKNDGRGVACNCG